MRLDWTTFKDTVDKRNLQIHFEEVETTNLGTMYYLSSQDTNITFRCTINDVDHASDVSDFETNYKNAGIEPKTWSFYKDAISSLESYDEKVLANGEKWFIESFSGSGIGTADLVVLLIDDYGGQNEEILAVCRGETDYRPIRKYVTGDGTKKIAIVIANNLAVKVRAGGQIDYFIQVKN